MPPLHSGDPGDGRGEDDRDADGAGFVPPLPPEDRLWRHPSEVARERARPSSPSASGRSSRRSQGRTAALVLASALAGAGIAVGAVAAGGGLDGGSEERVAMRATTVVEARSPLDADSVAARTAPALATVDVRRGDARAAGTAVVLRPDGYLVTDADLVEGADAIEVGLPSGWAGPARLVGVDPPTGVAVLHVDAEDLRPAQVGSVAGMAVGDRTVAVGAAVDAGSPVLVSTGVVAALHRRHEEPDGTSRYGMILVDRPFAPGTAGGALVDATGAVVGVASGQTGEDGGTPVGMATPIDLARLVAEQLIGEGHASHVWLGVHGTDLEPDEAAALELRGGAVVDHVVDGGPAARAGIRPGDVVVGLDGEATPSMAVLIARLQLHEPGDEVVLDVRRDGRELSRPVVLAAKPAQG